MNRTRKWTKYTGHNDPKGYALLRYIEEIEDGAIFLGDVEVSRKHGERLVTFTVTNPSTSIIAYGKSDSIEGAIATVESKFK